MKIIKQYLLVEISTTRINDYQDLSLGLGSYEYGNSPNSLFDTEEEAIEEAYKRNSYGRYAVIPQITFDNY